MAIPAPPKSQQHGWDSCTGGFQADLNKHRFQQKKQSFCLQVTEFPAPRYYQVLKDFKHTPVASRHAPQAPSKRPHTISPTEPPCLTCDPVGCHSSSDNQILFPSTPPQHPVKRHSKLSPQLHQLPVKPKDTPLLLQGRPSSLPPVPSSSCLSGPRLWDFSPRGL